MKRMTGGFLVLATVLATGAADLTAQQGRRGPSMRGMEGPPAGGVEAILRMRDRLELTDDQVAQLDAIRRGNVQRRTAEMTEMTELRSRLAAGLIQRSDVMAAMEDRREAARGQGEQRGERLESILTDEQRESLRRLGGRGRAPTAGRARGMRGQGGFGAYRRDRGGFRSPRGLRGGQQGRGAFRDGRMGRQGRGAFAGPHGRGDTPPPAP